MRINSTCLNILSFPFLCIFSMIIYLIFSIPSTELAVINCPHKKLHNNINTVYLKSIIEKSTKRHTGDRSETLNTCFDYQGFMEHAYGRCTKKKGNIYKFFYDKYKYSYTLNADKRYKRSKPIFFFSCIHCSRSS